MKKDKNAAKADFITEQAAPQKEVKKAPKKDKKPNIFKRLGMKIKDVFSELKKVSWPSFGTVVKKTGVVIVVVLAFLVVISAFDYGLMELLQLVSPSSTTEAFTAISKVL